MREDIKERIELIKKGQVPNEYKRVEYGIVNEKFQELIITQIGSFKNGINFSKGEGNNKLKFLGVGDFGNRTVIENTNCLEDICVSANDNSLESYFLKNDDIVFVRSNGSKELVGRNLLIKNPQERVVYSGFCIRYRLNSSYKKTTASYINAWLDNGILKEILKWENRGTNISNLNQEILRKIRIYIPKLNEQEKILKVIECYNKLVYMIDKNITYKHRQKQWLIQNLLTGKKRLSGFTEEWKQEWICGFIKEQNERSKENDEFEVLSVTKNGICLQSSQFNRQIASENNIGYKIIRKGNLVFSTMNLWMGSLDVLEEYDIGIVSPAYKVFEFLENKMIPEFGKHFMKSSHMIWLYNNNSEQGASIVRKNLDLEGLLKTTVKIPNIREQIAISKIIGTAEREIKLLEKKLELIKQEKKAIMQLLLTGIVRVSD